jgi:hypothetical protein
MLLPDQYYYRSTIRHNGSNGSVIFSFGMATIAQTITTRNTKSNPQDSVDKLFELTDNEHITHVTYFDLKEKKMKNIYYFTIEKLHELALNPNLCGATGVIYTKLKNSQLCKIHITQIPVEFSGIVRVMVQTISKTVDKKTPNYLNTMIQMIKSEAEQNGFTVDVYFE